LWWWWFWHLVNFTLSSVEMLQFGAYFPEIK
jgi:hypothetical protein